jgi:hypothetical protein
MLITEFKDCVYQKGFGFDLEVYEGEKGKLNVSSGNLLESQYDSFEEFLDDLVKKIRFGLLTTS